MFLTGLLVVVVGLIYWFPVRRWYLRWGATPEDRACAMIGDERVPRPTSETTHAVMIDARAECVWPWLVQMGYQRGGLYSYDWLDRLFGYLDRPSAETVLPEFQQLAVGDVIPLGRGPGFPVRIVAPPRALVLADGDRGFGWTWQFALVPAGRGQTRLVSRNRVRVPKSIGWRLFMLVLEPAAFIMTRKMLLGIKRRAETLAAVQRAEAARAARRWAHQQIA